jgi:hypothetical protein
MQDGWINAGCRDRGGMSEVPPGKRGTRRTPGLNFFLVS